MRSNSLSRTTYVVMAVSTIALGLLVHLRGAALGPVAHDVLGDALWAVMIVWWTGALAPRARLAVRGAAALAICFAVEVGQMYHAPTVEAIRRTQLGELILGTDFDPRDLAAYAAGVAGAVLLESVVLSRGSRARTVS